MTPWLSKSLNFLFWRKCKQIQIFCLMIQNLHQILHFFWFFWTGNHKSRKTILPFCCNLFQVDHFSVLDWLDYFSKQFTKPSFHLCWSLWKPSTRNSSQCVKSVQIWSYFWSVFSLTRTEWEEIQSTKYLSVFNPNAGKYAPEITPYLDTFHTVSVSKKLQACSPQLCTKMTCWSSCE